jgi:CPA1 family monovalent cation:H+ antiporter
MELHSVLLLTSGLLVVIGLIQPLATRIGLSPTVLLAVVGIAIGVGSAVLTHNDALARFAKIGKLIADLPISSDVFLYIFLRFCFSRPH